MDWAYLAISVNGALYTVNAYRPVALKRRYSSGWSFFASWITIELAWVHLVIQVATTAYFARKGVLRSGKGKLALLINIGSAVGLIGIVARSLKVRHEVRALFAVDDAPVLDKPRFGWKRTRNIPFAQIGRKSLKLDVYEPDVVAEPGLKRPAIIQIHGGGWVLGDKREQGLPLLKHLARRGWVGFNVNYRLSPKATYPDHLVDVKRALAWIREHADDYGIDPDFIAVTGGSAGGHLAAMLALTANDPALQPGFEEADTSIQAAVPFYGVFDFTNRGRHYPDDTINRFFGPIVIKAKLHEEPEKFAAASPMDHVRPDSPPFLVVHGSLDTLAPVQMARDFVEALRDVSKSPVLYLELQGAQHAFEIFPSIRANEVVRAVARFLEKVHDEFRHGREGRDISEEALVGTVDAAVTEPVSASGPE